MFTSLKTPQDYFNLSTKYLAAVPKTQDEVVEVFGKVKKVYQAEAANAQQVIATYQKAAKGDASVNDIALANKKAQDLFVATRFAAILTIPGSIFVLPFLAEAAKEFDVELFPQSIKEEFGI